MPNFLHFKVYFKLLQAILEDGREASFSLVCTPKPVTEWNNTDFLISHVVDPLCHVLCIICFLAIAIVYFILPQLRDLVGNIITTITICLIVAQAADLVRTFTEFSSHVSFLVAGKFLTVLSIYCWILFQPILSLCLFHYRCGALHSIDGCFFLDQQYGLLCS